MDNDRVETFRYDIDGIEFTSNTHNPPEFNVGSDQILSTSETDITYDQPWYNKGFSIKPFLRQAEFEALKTGLTRCVQKIIEDNGTVCPKNFSLESYHQVVLTNEDHYRVVSKTRDLFPQDFNFPITEVLEKFKQIIGFQLTDINPDDNQKLHIIVRINRPHSNDFNPPHKDIYEGFDGDNQYIPQFVNIWIPIAGVTERSSLPIVEASHLLPESCILRTREGGKIGSNQYRVRMIKEWNGSNALTRSSVTYGEALFFSSHLVHGLAVNKEPDTTRVALEFRLFKAPTNDAR